MPHQPFKSRIIGLGGAGIGALQQIIAEGVPASDVIAANTDVQSLSASSAGTKIQLGRRVSRGLGAGGDPEIGMAAAEESLDEIRDAVRGCNLVVLATGLGGGTGSGAAPVIARAIAESGAYVVAIATMPFHFEGRRRAKQASDALAALRAAAHAVIVFENDRMGEPLGPQAGVHEAFANADQTISRAALGIITIACRESLIQLSLDEIFKAVALRDARCLFGFGLSNSKDRAIDALEQALQNPLMDRGLLLEHCENLVVQVNGGGEMTLIEVQELMEALGRLIGENTQVLFGLGADPALGSCVSVIILGSVPEAEYARRRQALQQASLEERNIRTPAIRAQQTHPAAAPASQPAEPPPPRPSPSAAPPAQTTPAAQQTAHAPQSAEPAQPAPRPPQAAQTAPQFQAAQTAPAMRPPVRQSPPPAPQSPPAPVQPPLAAPRSQPPPLFAGRQTGERPADLLLAEDEDQRPPEERLERRPPAPRAAAAQPEPPAHAPQDSGQSRDDEAPRTTQPAFGPKRPAPSPPPAAPAPEAAPPQPAAAPQNPISALVRRFSSPPAERAKTADNPPASRQAAPEPAPPPAAPPLLDVDEQEFARRGAARVVRPRAEAARPKQEFFQFDQNSTRGRFEKSDPTIIDGEDLDIPTFMRQNRKP